VRIAHEAVSWAWPGVGQLAASCSDPIKRLREIGPVIGIFLSGIRPAGPWLSGLVTTSMVSCFKRLTWLILTRRLSLVKRLTLLATWMNAAPTPGTHPATSTA
jgi:hypothetical protein